MRDKKKKPNFISIILNPAVDAVNPISPRKLPALPELSRDPIVPTSPGRDAFRAFANSPRHGTEKRLLSAQPAFSAKLALTECRKKICPSAIRTTAPAAQAGLE